MQDLHYFIPAVEAPPNFSSSPNNDFSCSTRCSSPKKFSFSPYHLVLPLATDSS